MFETEFVVFVRLIFGILGLLAGLVSAVFAYKMIRDPQLVLTHFQLQPDQVYVDLKILLGNYVVMFSGFFVYTIGRIIENPLMVDIGRLTGIVYAILMIVVFSRWIKRA